VITLITTLIIMEPALAVRQFTVEARQPAPDRPQPMDLHDVHFIATMMLDELFELYATVTTPEVAKDMMHHFIDKGKSVPQTVYPKNTPQGEISLIADQADALVDMEYYLLNCACKQGVNLSSVFKIVHAANMAKRDPETGVFLKRDDGKIIKPVGWQPPDVDAEIARQLKDGAWQARQA
jgi:predicted HAD superfamily Cof-like phosphohydrolase